MRSSWSLGAVYIVLGGLSVSGLGGRRPVALPPAAWVLAGLLVFAGALLFTRTRIAFYAALAVGALTAISGIAALLGHPELSLPVHPGLSIGIGLYLVFRTALSAASFARRTPTGFIPKPETEPKPEPKPNPPPDKSTP
jgi:hypothetical protein